MKYNIKSHQNLSNLNSIVIEQEGRVFLEITEHSKELNLFENSFLNYSIVNGAICIEEYKIDDNAEQILNEIIELFEGQESTINKFLMSKRPFFEHKNALSILNTEEGQNLIKDYIYRLKTGGFS
jgi:hypothetical protein